MNAIFRIGLYLLLFPALSFAQAQNFANDQVSFGLPTLTQKPNGNVVLYWSEKDGDNNIALYFAESADAGKTFSDKKLIYKDAGIGIGRLARPKLLFKKNGNLVAVFTWRAPAPPKTMAEGSGGHDGHHGSQPPAPAAKPKRDSQIRFMESKNNGKTWSAPVSVDSDADPLVRGFFDAAILPNDEIAVAYLKDVKGSTKHEERDLRLVVTKKGVFQPEKLIDAVVCDCCSINLLVDQSGKLNIFYRDNNDDVRDIARIVSSDNAQTFGKSEILYADNWKIPGCPHTVTVSTLTREGAYVSWYSGSEENPGVRVVNAKGELVSVLDQYATPNQSLDADGTNTVWVWEQDPSSNKAAKQLSYAVLKGTKAELKGNIPNTEFGGNPSVLLVKGKALVAYEVGKPETKTAMQVIEVGY